MHIIYLLIPFIFLGCNHDIPMMYHRVDSSGNSTGETTSIIPFSEAPFLVPNFLLSKFLDLNNFNFIYTSTSEYRSYDPAQESSLSPDPEFAPTSNEWVKEMLRLNKSVCKIQREREVSSIHFYQNFQDHKITTWYSVHVIRVHLDSPDVGEGEVHNYDCATESVERGLRSGLEKILINEKFEKIDRLEFRRIKEERFLTETFSIINKNAN
jgi:hypothetical protein